MLNVFAFVGVACTDPVILQNKDGEGWFAKFTVMIRGNLGNAARKQIERQHGQSMNEDWGDVYIDCIVNGSKFEKHPKENTIKGIKKHDIVSGRGRIVPRKKPVRDEEAGYRTNWVYGDYIGVKLEELHLVSGYQRKGLNPYFLDSIVDAEEKGKFGKDESIVAYDQKVEEDDLIFEL